MADAQVPTRWLLTPLAAVAGTLVGSVLVFYVQAELVPALAGGYEVLCETVECFVGTAALLVVGGFVALCLSLIAGAVVGVRNKADPDGPSAVRRGILISVWCVLAYVVESTVMWFVL